MRNLRVCGSSNVNWYTQDFITVTGIKYKIYDAEWFGLEEFWVLKVKKAK